MKMKRDEKKLAYDKSGMRYFSEKLRQFSEASINI